MRWDEIWGDYNCIYRDEPDYAVTLHNDFDGKIHNELEELGFIKVVEWKGENWWILTDEAVELGKIIRSFNKL